MWDRSSVGPFYRLVAFFLSSVGPWSSLATVLPVVSVSSQALPVLPELPSHSVGDIQFFWFTWNPGLRTQRAASPLSVYQGESCLTAHGNSTQELEIVDQATRALESRIATRRRNPRCVLPRKRASIQSVPSPPVRQPACLPARPSACQSVCRPDRLPSLSIYPGTS